MLKICIECSGDYDEWVAGRSVSNPVHTDWCSNCGHRRQVICYTPAHPLITPCQRCGDPAEIHFCKPCFDHLYGVMDVEWCA
jgi:hypothetical protein